MVVDSNLLRNLDYLHDAKCIEVAWDCTRYEMRSIRIRVIVDHDAGFSAWDGKTLLITLSDVFAVRFSGWAVIGEECIDDWKQGVSDSLERDCEVLRSKGIVLPPLKFLVSFRSGSELEVICSDMSVVEYG